MFVQLFGPEKTSKKICNERYVPCSKERLNKKKRADKK
jgi:hypothetical protein